MGSPRRFVFELAEKLGRTVGELLEGSPSHKPISGWELMQWEALYIVRADEAERAAKKNK